MKSISIVDLVAWAFKNELPKAERVEQFTATAGIASSAGMIADFGVLGTLVDTPINRWGVVPIYGLGDDQPHPDAVLVGNAVRSLGRCKVRIGDDWQPFPDWPDPDGLIARAVAVERRRLETRAGHMMVADIIAQAITGRSPDWQADMPKRRMVCRKGKPVWFVQQAGVDGAGHAYERETDGFDARKRRPMPGAYRKYELSRTISGDVTDRFKRANWAAGLYRVAELISNQMEFHTLSNNFPLYMPWTYGENDTGLRYDFL